VTVSIHTANVPSKRISAELTVFFGLTFALAWLCWFPFVLSELGALSLPTGIASNASLSYVIILAAGGAPMAAAIIVTFYFHRLSGLRELFKAVLLWRVPFRWYAAAFFTPVSAYAGAAIIYRVFVSDGTYTLPTIAQILNAFIGTFPFLLVLIIYEELGWRGFALPRLQVFHNPLKASVILGMIWSVWHFPYWFIHSYPYTKSLVMACLALASGTLSVMALTILMTWIYNSAKGSVLLMMILHAANNTSLTLITDPSMPNGTVILIGFGLLTVFALVVLAVYGPMLSKSPPVTDVVVEK
jgi:membrane protease YdiL (CAAX protease family)